MSESRRGGQLYQESRPARQGTAAMRCVWMGLLLMTAASGCAQTAVVKYWAPAPIDVSQLKRVAVLEFSGTDGTLVSSTLFRELSDTHFFAVVDKASLDEEIRRIAWSRQEKDRLSDALAAARETGIDGLILGNVIDYSCSDRVVENTSVRMFGDPEAEDRSYRVGGAGFGLKTQRKSVRSAQVTIDIRLLDVHTGETRAAYQVARRYAAEQAVGENRLPSREVILQSLLDQCVAEIVTTLAPHEEACEIELARCDFWSGGRIKMLEGIAAAKLGQWQDAGRLWKEVAAADPNNHAALFNLAVAAAHAQDYAAAEEYAMQALRLQHRDTYAAGLETIRTRRAEFNRSQDQREALAVTANESAWR